MLTQTPTNDDSGAFGVLLKGDDTEVTQNTISGSDAFSYDYVRDGAAIEIYGGQRNDIHHNQAADNDVFSELGNSRSADNTFAYNLVLSSLSDSVFVVTRGPQSGYGPVYGTRLYSNSVRLTGANSQGFVCHAGCGPDILRMRNNIISAVKKTGYADAPFDEDYDLFFGGPSSSPRGQTAVWPTRCGPTPQPGTCTCALGARRSTPASISPIARISTVNRCPRTATASAGPPRTWAPMNTEVDAAGGKEEERAAYCGSVGSTFRGYG